MIAGAMFDAVKSGSELGMAALWAVAIFSLDTFCAFVTANATAIAIVDQGKKSDRA